MAVIVDFRVGRKIDAVGHDAMLPATAFDGQDEPASIGRAAFTDPAADRLRPAI
jgi:hypothetical protein